MGMASDILDDIDTLFEDWEDTSLTGGTTINILFDNEYQEIIEVSSAGPAALCKTSDVPNAKKGDIHVITSVLCNVSAVSYTVEKAMKNPPDAGPGVTRLIFKKT